MAGMRTETVKANDLDFTVRTAGDGDRLALLLHGFPDDAGSMDPLLDRLADSGFRAVAPYMRGYGPTEAPADEDYTLGSLAEDIHTLEATLRPGDANTLLIGHDWGAMAGYVAVQVDESPFEQFVSLAVPPQFWHRARENPQQLFRSWYLTFFQLPVIPEDALRANDFALIEWFWRSWSPNWTYSEERLAAVKETFRCEGTVHASIQYYRDLYHSISSHGFGLSDADPDPLDIMIPTLVLAGECDGVIGPEMFEGVESDLLGLTKLRRIDSVGHFMQQESPDVIADLILEFWTEHRA